MMNIPVEYPTDWSEYELLDSGNGEKLEKFGIYTLVRPDPRALWQKSLPPDEWDKADAKYRRTDSKTGVWESAIDPAKPWLLHYGNLTFILKPTEFKHVGVFPEQAVNWNWLSDVINGKPLNILNLFAYTGGATMAALSAGAKVTHVDASKSTITWANENLKASNLADKPVRWIEDDVYKFVSREAKRGNTYDGIILDPPRFGRGSKGEVWKLEDDLPKLLAACKHILSKSPAFLLVNAYTSDISSIVLQRLVTDMTTDLIGSVTSGELALKESTHSTSLRVDTEQRFSLPTELPRTGDDEHRRTKALSLESSNVSKTDRLLPNGIFARWSRNSG